MNTLKVSVSGPLKEKAMLLSIIGDKLRDAGIEVVFEDNAMDRLVRTNCGDDCLIEFKELNLDVDLKTENLQNSNTVEDLTALHTKLANQAYGTDFFSDSHDFNVGIWKVRDEIGKILLIQ